MYFIEDIYQVLAPEEWFKATKHVELPDWCLILIMCRQDYLWNLHMEYVLIGLYMNFLNYANVTFTIYYRD